ncbi:MAG: hypothetical protein ABR920_09815 [Terriglobales bacterium]
MLHVKLEESRILTDPAYLTVGARLMTTDVAKLDIKIATKECRVDKPDGSLLFMLIKGAILENVWRPAYQLLRTVSGDLSNRPNVIGSNLRLPTMRKNGSVSNFNMAPKAVVAKFGGNADLLGFYKYKNPAPGVVDCAPTAWTEGKNGGLSPVYSGCIDFIRKVDEVYRLMLEPEYKRQKAVVQAVPPNFRILDTAFTTLYVLRNAPTAVHTDDFDAEGTFGCMASLGEWEGNALVFPKYRIGCNYQPGDVILADVHEMHGNLPLLSGERVACVFFVRTGMNQCS